MFTNQYQIIPEATRKDAIEYCRSCRPNEGCGVVVDDEFIPFENKADNPKNEFLIKDDEFTRLMMDDKIQVVIHSHNEYPHASYNDQAQQRALDIPFAIINFRHGTCEHFITWGDGLKPEPLKMRPFFFGVFDCLTLARDYFIEQFGICIPTPLRQLNYWKNDQPLFEENTSSKDHPVSYIDISEAKAHDVYFYKMGGSKYINHVGVILENGRMLHHFINKVSCSVPASFYQRDIFAAGRLDRDWESD